MTPTPAGASLPAAASTRSPVRLACLSALVLALALAACTPSADKESGEARYSAQITGYNHTGEYIHRFYLDDVSGGNVFAYTGGGSFVCCIRCPTRWTPGLQIRVRWSTSSSDPDATAEEVWHEAVVPVEKFARPGGVRVHFLPGETVRIVVSNLLAGHADYPGPARPVAPADFKFKLQ